MNDLIVKLSADRRAWLFVAAGTLFLGLVFVMPAVDDYFELRADRSDLADRRMAADRTVERVRTHEARVKEQEEKLSQLRAKTLSEDETADFRNGLIKLVRGSGCQLRRLNVSSPRKRLWRSGDNPLEAADKQAAGTPFELETRVVSLSLSGTMPRVRELLKQIQESERLAFGKTIRLNPDQRNRRQVELNLELWYYALSRSDQA